jgi:DNA polymerase-3 subunit gamma/tau
MSNNSQVLALKYRPKSFNELVGQESVAKSLKIALQGGRLGNAYLFSGLRGSGKTSSARIFSKTILCEQAPTSTPCEECDSCKMANSGSHIDIVEMDGASNRGIDKIRELIEQTHYKPSTGKYKIFIIDEVHMLTKEAFNALLKTLEEPPDYIKFILATTDPLKLPPTILSRTQHFAFKRIERQKVIEHISKILKIENITFEDQAIEVIARSGNGSLRDTLTLLEQAIIYTDRDIRLTPVTEMLGLVDPELLNQLLKNILEKNREAILEMVADLESYEVELILDELIQHLKGELLKGTIPLSTLQKFFEILNESKKLLFSQADNGFILLLTLLKMISFDEVEEKRVIQVVEQVQTEQHQPATTQKSQEVQQQNNSDGLSDLQIRFQGAILAAVEGNNETKQITNQMLRSCLMRHFTPISFRGGVLQVQFYYESDESSSICRHNIIRHRHKHFLSVLERHFQFNGQDGRVKWAKHPSSYDDTVQQKVETPQFQQPVVEEQHESFGEIPAIDAVFDEVPEIESFNESSFNTLAQQPPQPQQNLEVQREEIVEKKIELIDADNIEDTVKEIFFQ